MSRFTSPLQYQSTNYFVSGRKRKRKTVSARGRMFITLVGARRMVEITSPFSFFSETYSLDVAIEAGYKTDLGSIPAVARWLLSPNDPWAQIYVIHDKLFEKGDPRAANVLREGIKLPFRIYYEGLEYHTVCPRLLQYLVFFAVWGNQKYKEWANQYGVDHADHAK